MKLTSRQEKEIFIWEYFAPQRIKYPERNDEDIKKFLEWSERGLHRERGMLNEASYFEKLREGKRWAGIHMRMYEEGVLDGSMPYMVILGGFDKTVYRIWWKFWKPKYNIKHDPIPRIIVDFMKKEMFKGIDSELIEKCYNRLTNEPQN